MTDAQSAIYMAAIAAGKTANEAYALAFPSSNTNNFSSGYTYTHDGTTIDINSLKPTLVSYPSASYSNFINNNRFTVLIPADTTLDEIIDGRITADIDLSHIADASLSPNVNTISAQKFTTTYSNGTVLVVGDDVYIKDVNVGNGIGVIGNQSYAKGWVKFGTNGPLVGYNGTAAFPLPGDDLYAITGSMLIKTNHLYFYNGQAANGGWATIV
jgi:hypothetical protein